MPAHTSTADADAIAAFLAKKGATKIAAGKSALNLTRRQWGDVLRHPDGYKGVQSDAEQRLIDQRRVLTEQRLIDERHIVTLNDGTEVVINGLGEAL